MCMGRGIYCAFSLINVTKHGACQCAPGTLSPPHTDSHELGGMRIQTHRVTQNKQKMQANMSRLTDIPVRALDQSKSVYLFWEGDYSHKHKRNKQQMMTEAKSGQELCTIYQWTVCGKSLFWHLDIEQKAALFLDTHIAASGNIFTHWVYREKQIPKQTACFSAYFLESVFVLDASDALSSLRQNNWLIKWSSEGTWINKESDLSCIKLIPKCWPE